MTTTRLNPPQYQTNFPHYNFPSSKYHKFPNFFSRARQKNITNTHTLANFSPFHQFNCLIAIPKLTVQQLKWHILAETQFFNNITQTIKILKLKLALGKKSMILKSSQKETMTIKQRRFNMIIDTHLK